MDDIDDHGRRLRAARALADLALDFADRAQAVEADLIRQFRTAAAPLAGELGPLVVESDEDEQVLLRADGALAGEVLDEDTGAWRAIDEPAEVARYYDPTDLFLDLAEAVVERYPELEDEFPGTSPGREPPEPWREETASMWHDARGPLERREAPDGGAPADDEAAGPGGARPAIAATLENLRRSGALSDAEFERLRSQLEG